MIKIVVDGFGGDGSPDIVVKGAIKATKELSDLHIVITGKEDVLLNLLKENGYDPNRFTIVDAPEVVEVNAPPTVEFKKKPDSSMVRAFDILRKEEDVAGLVSAGSSGAVLTGGIFKLGRISGVSRPAFAPIFPTMGGKMVVLCDSGANAECKPINIAHFAVMASQYFKAISKEENPRVGLLNIGAEEEKGNTQYKEFHEYLKKVKDINFIGNIEGFDIMADKCEVVVCDGFAGNIALKSAEGAIKFMNTMLKKEIKASFWAKIGAVTFMKGALTSLKKNLKKYVDKGAVLLGCKKLLVKAHGNSNENVFCDVILQTAELASAGLCEKIAKEFETYEFPETE